MGSASHNTSDDLIPETELATVPVTRGRFTNAKVRRLLHSILGGEEVDRLATAGVDRRMVFGINSYYLALVTGAGFQLQNDTGLPVMPPSAALLALVMPRAGETADLSGEQDPSNQNRYSPNALKGRVIHKYDEIVLGHAALACSAHCRYCYRLDLFNRTTGKSTVRPEELRDYIVQHNRDIEPELSSTFEVRRYPITEVVLSGGDPLVLSNRQLYRFLEAVADAGVGTVRIGTKEIVFRPARFDFNFIKMLQVFNSNYPGVHVKFMMHFTHPDEFLERDLHGNYLNCERMSTYKWLSIVDNAITALRKLHFVSIENQTALIRGVNDQSRVLHILHKELSHKGIKSQYTLQCREIEGHKYFAVPIETAWRIHNAAQKGLTSSERSRFALSTESGKLEVVSVIEDDSQWRPAETDQGRFDRSEQTATGLVVFKVLRSPGAGETQGNLIVARSNPAALWISDYEDRILLDGRRQSWQKKEESIRKWRPNGGV
jgi:lysine 2,3-aminomutase